MYYAAARSVANSRGFCGAELPLAVVSEEMNE